MTTTAKPAAGSELPPAEAGGRADARMRHPLEGYVRSSYCVWEITLACNLECIHCGSRAGAPRPDELNTAECLDVVRQLAEVGITEVSLIGGEAFLRPDWLQISQAIADAGMLCTMTTGGYGISLATAEKMRDAGISYVSVSIDGLEASHDLQRGKQGSWAQCFKTFEMFKKAGLHYAANTQLNRYSAPEIPQLYELLRDAGIESWQPQMTVPMGNAADHPEMLLQPAELLDLYPMLARVVSRAIAEGILVQPGSSVGYYSPYEHILRKHGFDNGQFWMGCQAGLSVIGIEADGKVKGDPSLPTDAYTAGNIRNTPLRKILASPLMTFNMGGGTPEGTKHLWGYCKGCKYAELCRGGCTWSSHVFFGKRGNMVYCHHRALDLAKQGLRERVVRKLLAIGVPFDHGKFEIIVEPLDAPWPEGDPLHFTKDKVVWPRSFEAWPAV